MTTRIGPNFGNELAAAGLAGLPFAWASDGTITGETNLTSAQQTALVAVVAAHDPTKPDLRLAASLALAKSDTTMHRIAEAVATGVNSWTGADVVAWVNWRKALRSVVANPASVSALPAQPAYPAGT